MIAVGNLKNEKSTENILPCERKCNHFPFQSPKFTVPQNFVREKMIAHNAYLILFYPTPFLLYPHHPPCLHSHVAGTVPYTELRQMGILVTDDGRVGSRTETGGFVVR